MKIFDGIRNNLLLVHVIGIAIRNIGIIIASLLLKELAVISVIVVLTIVDILPIMILDMCD